MNARRRAGKKPGRVAEHQFPHVHRMKTVHVLCRINAREDDRLVNGRRQGCLDENAVNGRVGIEARNETQQFGLAGVFGKDGGGRTDSEAFGGALLHADVHLRGGVFADADEGEAGLDAPRLECLDTGAGSPVHLFRDRPTVNELGSGTHGANMM